MLMDKKLSCSPISLNISDRNSSYSFSISLRTLLKICIADQKWLSAKSLVWYNILALHLRKDVNSVILSCFGLPLKLSFFFFDVVLFRVV